MPTCIFIQNHEIFFAISVIYSLSNKFKLYCSRKYSVKHIVHVQKNLDRSYRNYDLHKTFYFIELDLISASDQTVHRFSRFVQYSNQQKEICFMEDMRWRADVKITLLTTVKNQGIWVKYLLQTLEKIMEKTKEKNVCLLVLSFLKSHVDDAK